MNYIQQAFGDLNPLTDQDAAIKFALNSILMDARFDELASLLRDGDDLGGMEGEPGWIIERRDGTSSEGLSYYASWPIDASFHAYVNPAAFFLAYPDAYMKANEFQSYVKKALCAHLERNPMDATAGNLLGSQLSEVRFN